MSEEVLMGNGVVLNPGYSDYKMPRSTDTPPMHTIHIITDDPVGPFGAKEIGEGFIVANPGAISGAIHDATGVWVKHLPITAEKILWAMKEKTQTK